ncbi:MAG TPA: M56 family metallopeptidase [Bryobacteraceae bacterium]|jgi:TonB family protein|nr:M56 family metallopeptidase [Bryobacteraceae bacterium]
MPLPLWHHDARSKSFVTVTEISSHISRDAPYRNIDWLLLCWAAGVVITAMPFVVGSLSIVRILRRAEPFTDGILLSDVIPVPLTCGLVKPRILLPMSAKAWTAATREAVLLHERAHIRRRDVLTHAVAHFVACLWWFQPLVWLLHRRLKAASEFACDAEALRSGIRPTDYASELLSIARNAAAFQVPASAIGMLQASHLEQRVRTVLYPSTASVSPMRLGCLALTLTFAALAASAFTTTSTTAYPTGGLTMKRALLSALLSSAGLSAASITGTVHDPNGAAVPDAVVTLTNADNSAQLQATTNTNGQFSVNGSGAGDYILRISKTGLNSVYYEFSLNARSEIDSEFTMPAEGTPAPDTPMASKPVQVEGADAQNNLIHKVNPTYPGAAKQNRVQGTVQIRALISKDGVPQELKILSSPSDELSESALFSVRQWRYRPTLVNGNPVEISTMVVVNYTLLP